MTWGAPTPGPWLLGRPRLPDLPDLPDPAGRAGAAPQPRVPVQARPQVARPGELVLVVPATPALPLARGPVAGPLAEAGRTGLVPFAVDTIVRLAPAPRTLAGRLLAGSGLGPGLERWRTHLVAAAEGLDSGLPAGLLAALLFGERSGLERSTTDLFTRTGTRHLLAISGLHVGLLAAWLVLPGAGLLARLLRRPRLTPVLVAAALALFVPLAGSTPPVIRAALVLGLGLAGRRSGPFGRRIDGLNLWGAALLAEGLCAPWRLTSLSLQLSYLATLGLVLGLAPLARVLEGRLRAPLACLPGTGLEPWRPSWARPRRAIVLRAGTRLAALAMGSSLAAVLATLPLSWATFGELAPIGILLTPLVLPLLGYLLTLAWPTCAALALLGASAPGSAAEQALADLAGALLQPAGQLLGRLLALADRLPGTPVALPQRPGLLVGLACLLTFLHLRQGRAVDTASSLRGRGLTRAGVGLAWSALLLPWSLAPRGLELVALDVGHGTAVALRGPSGRPWLFDGGSRDRIGAYREALAPLLATWDGGDPIVVVSHADRDHWSALAELVHRHPPARWLGHVPLELAAWLPPRCERSDLTAGGLDLDGEAGLDLMLLRGAPLEGNEGSRSLLVRASGGPGVLLTGDAEAEGLARLLEAGLLEPVDLLLLPHHGSDSDQLAPLLAATKPGEVWISGSSVPQLGPELERRGLLVRETRSEGPLGLTAAPAEVQAPPDPP